LLNNQFVTSAKRRRQKIERKVVFLKKHRVIMSNLSRGWIDASRDISAP